MDEGAEAGWRASGQAGGAHRDKDRNRNRDRAGTQHSGMAGMAENRE
jgi:hypothetical protein